MRTRRAGAPAGIVAFGWLLAAAALLLAGCAEEPGSLGPGIASCIVQGSFNRAGPDDRLTVSFEMVAPEGESAHYDVVPGDGGAYRIEVPAGDYVIYTSGMIGRCYYTTDGRLPTSRADADTVRLDAAHSPFTVDFGLGALRLEATFPAEFEGVTTFLEVVRSSDGREATTDNWTISDGRAVLTASGLVPDSYFVRVRWRFDFDREGGRLWLPGSYDRAQATAYRVGADSVVTVAADLAAPPSHLVGRVGGAWLAMGLDRPTLNAVDADSLAVLGPWRVDEDGSFDLVLPGPAAVKLGVRSIGITRWIGGDDFGSATLFEPAEGETIDGIELIGSGLRLRVAREGLAESYDQARLTFHDPVDLSLRYVTYGSLSGQIGIANLPAGDWLVHVEPSSYYRRRWRPQWLDRAATAAEATVLTIPAAGGVLVSDLVLEAGGVIRGQLLQAPASAYIFSLWATTDDDMAALPYRFILSGDGQFECTGLPDGRYKVGVASGIIWDPGGDPPATIWYPGTTDWATAGVVTINDAGTVEGVEITFP